MQDFVPFGGPAYFMFFGLLAAGRGLDFLSTWLATPNLILEANPLARRLGWRLGGILNVVVCIGFAMWPLPALVIFTTSVLVAARNFQLAWLMNTMGEQAYRQWMSARFVECHPGLFVGCVLAQATVFIFLGISLVWFSSMQLVPFSIGVGMIGYAIAVAFYTFLTARRYRRGV